MPRHIGIVAVSAEGAALCYRTICAEGTATFGPYNHPEVTMHTIPLAAHMHHIEAGRWGDEGGLLLQSARKLADAGADFLICPDNTAHEAIDTIRERSPRPWLHIAEEVAAVAKQRGYRSVGVLGTRYLMEGALYPKRLAAAGVGHIIPDPEDRELINRVIFDDLVYGRFEKSARAEFVRIIGKLKQSGCDAVALSCTEIPLLIGDEHSPLPTLDSTRILARAALSEAARL
jgi:aspartate racemase